MKKIEYVNDQPTRTETFLPELSCGTESQQVPWAFRLQVECAMSRSTGMTRDRIVATYDLHTAGSVPDALAAAIALEQLSLIHI